MPLTIHVVEPGRPGGGMFSLDHPDYLVLNTPCGQHSMYPFPDQVGDDRLGLGFYEWAQERGYRWQGADFEGTDCLAPGQGTGPGPAGAEAGEAVGPHDFLPRRVMGEYLEWFYQVLCTEAPSHVNIVHHRAAALDLEPTDDGREKTYLDNGEVLVVDHVLLTTGHMRSSPKHGAVSTLSTEPYPMEPYLAATGPQDKVAIEGMGLVALDVITALTLGLGGTYTEEEGGRLRYHPSGREPSLYVFSRSGYPYCAKSFGATDPMGDYKPAICTVDAVTYLKRRDAEGKMRQIDARRELLPLVFAEMELCYYTCAARLQDGGDVAAEVREVLIDAWTVGTFEYQRSLLAARYGDFVASDHFFVGQGHHYTDAADYQAQVYDVVAADAHEAQVTGGASPVKAALETLRALRDTLRLAIEFKGLTLDSHLDFLAHMQSRFARLVAGAPVFRSQQLLALMDAGVLHMPFGPAPEIAPDRDGRARVRSSQFDQPFEVVVDRLIRAHLDHPSVSRSRSPLLNNLVQRGRVRPLDFDGTPVGSIDLNREFHPVNKAGQAEHRLWVFGVLSEGVRYFTLYIPSPKSRVRAFIDAETCAEAVLGAQAPPALVNLRARAVGPSAVELGASPGPRPVRVALVNNMPDGAFEESERRFRDLVVAGPASDAVEFKRYALPGVLRSAEVAELISGSYEDLAQLYNNPPDALIITGAEPKRADLAEELYWPALERLLTWAPTVVPSALVSCLAAHATVWAFDRLPRRLLLHKCTGVFAQVVDGDNPLMAGVTDLAVPHSRFNDIPVEDMVAKGYQVLSASADASWTVAVTDKGRCQFTLLQGHPEYEVLSLLREYRRDVRRYILGSQGSYPRIPLGYMDDDAIDALTHFQREVTRRPPDSAFMDDFPYEFAARHVRSGWEQPARVMMANWLQSVRQRVGSRLYSETGA